MSVTSQLIQKVLDLLFCISYFNKLGTKWSDVTSIVHLSA